MRYLYLIFALILFAYSSANSASLPVTIAVTSQNPAPFNVGETSILSGADSGNAGLLLSQNITLSQPATIQSLSFYVVTASGNLRLGIYDATGTGGGPGALKAQTNSVVAVAGWNTAAVITPILLPVGNYWIAYAPSSNTLSFRKGITSGTSILYHTFTFGSFPTTFPTPTTSDPNHWSFYATFVPQLPTLSLSFNPSNPVIDPSSPLGTFVTTIVPTLSDGSQFTGSINFTAPNYNANGIFALSGKNLIINPMGPGVANLDGTTQSITITVVQ